MAERLLYYIENGKFKVPIVIREMRFFKHNWWLEDGYTTWQNNEPYNIEELLNG